MAMETLPLTRVKSLPPPSDLSFTSLTLVTCRRACSTGIPIFHRRGRPTTTTTTTTTPCALLLCFFHALILEPGSPFVTPSQPPQHVKYSTPTGLTTTASSSDASYTDGALVGTICQRKTLILVGLMGLGLATRLVDLIDLGLVSRSSVTNLFFNRYRFFHSWTWAVCLNKITKSPPNTGSPSRPCPLVDTPSPKVLSYGLQQFPPYESTSCFVVSISIMELEMMLGPSGSPYVSLNMFSDVYEIHIVFSEITDGDRAVCLLDYLVSSSFSPGCSAPLQTYSLGCMSFTTMSSLLEL